MAPVRCWWFIGRVIFYKRSALLSCKRWSDKITAREREGGWARMVEERRGMELSRIFACGLACAGCAANPEQNCRERFKASLAPYFRPTFERISRVHTLFRALCVCMRFLCCSKAWGRLITINVVGESYRSVNWFRLRSEERNGEACSPDELLAGLELLSVKSKFFFFILWFVTSCWYELHLYFDEIV